MKRLVFLLSFSVQAMNVELKKWSEIEEPHRLENIVEQFLYEPELFNALWKLPRRAARKLVQELMKDHPIMSLFEGREPYKNIALGYRLIKQVCFSPDDEELLIVDGEDKAKVLSASRFSYCSLKRHDTPIVLAYYSPGGTYSIGIAADATVQIWSTGHNKCLHILESHTKRVRGTSCTPDEKYIATGSDDTTVKIWNMKSGQLIHTLDGHVTNISSVSLNPHGDTIASSSSRTVRLWDVHTGECISNVLYEAQVDHIEWDSTGTQLLIVSYDNVHIRKGESVKYSLHHRGWVNTAHFDRSGSRIITACSDGGVRIFSVKTKGCLRIFTSGGSMLYAKFVGKNDTILYESSDKVVTVCDGTTGECLLVDQSKNRPIDVCLNSTATRLAVSRINEDLYVRDTDGIAYYFMNEITFEQALLIYCIGEIIEVRNKENQEQEEAFIPGRPISSENGITFLLSDYHRKLFDSLRDDVIEVLKEYVCDREKRCVIA